MLCPQGITPVLYETGEGSATTSLVSLGNLKGKEGFKDTIMEEALGDEGNEFQAMLEERKQFQKQSPSPPRDCYEDQTDYSSDDSAEVFTTDETFLAGLFDRREQSQDEAQANVTEREQSQYEAQADVNEREQSQDETQANVNEREESQRKTQANVNEREQSQTKAQANLNKEVQTQEMAQASDPKLSDKREQPILTQQKVMDLIMQHQTQPNNTSEGLAASIWATKKEGFKDMHVEWISESHRNNVPGSVGFGICTFRFGGCSGCQSEKPNGTKRGTTKIGCAGGKTPRNT